MDATKKKLGRFSIDAIISSKQETGSDSTQLKSSKNKSEQNGSILNCETETNSTETQNGIANLSKQDGQSSPSDCESDCSNSSVSLENHRGADKTETNLSSQQGFLPFYLSQIPPPAQPLFRQPFIFPHHIYNGVPLSQTHPFFVPSTVPSGTLHHLPVAPGVLSNIPQGTLPIGSEPRLAGQDYIDLQYMPQKLLPENIRQLDRFDRDIRHTISPPRNRDMNYQRSSTPLSTDGPNPDDTRILEKEGGVFFCLQYLRLKCVLNHLFKVSVLRLCCYNIIY